MTEVSSTRAAITPREVIQRMHALAQEDISGQADLYAPDGVLEWPFAPPDVPRRVQGREEIRRVLESLAQRVSRGGVEVTGVCSFHLHETSDPEVTIVELEVEAKSTRTGDAFTLPYVQVFRIRGGQILSFRDYFGPATAQAVAAALGSAQ